MTEELVVRQIEGKGQGIFAQRSFVAGEVVEKAPVVVLPGDQYQLLDQTRLGDYYFDWDASQCAVPLGLSLLYNHSDFPNAATIRHFESAMIEFVAICDIKAGEEITHKYACPPWFVVRE